MANMLYDTNIVYLPNIEQNELDTSYSNLMKYYSPWIVSHTIISIDMYYAYARQPLFSIVFLFTAL
jgi:hypothetical protein